MDQGITPATAPSLRTHLPEATTGVRSFGVMRGDQQVGTLRWREFATSQGWQYLKAGGGPRPRLTFQSMADALHHQGGFTVCQAVDMVIGNTDAFELAEGPK
jgi:hypothetical protein